MLELLDTSEAAAYLGISTSALQKARSRANHLPWKAPVGSYCIKTRRWLYAQSDLDAWTFANDAKKIPKHQRGRKRLGVTIEAEKNGAI